MWFDPWQRKYFGLNKSNDNNNTIVLCSNAISIIVIKFGIYDENMYLYMPNRCYHNSKSAEKSEYMVYTLSIAHTHTHIKVMIVLMLTMMRRAVSVVTHHTTRSVYNSIRNKHMRSMILIAMLLFIYALMTPTQLNSSHHHSHLIEYCYFTNWKEIQFKNF